MVYPVLGEYLTIKEDVDFFGKLASWALPFLKELFPVVGKRVLFSGVGLGQDLFEGQNIKMAAKKRLKEGSSKLLEKAAAKLQTGGRRRRRKRRKKNLKLQKSKPSYHLKRRKTIKRRKKKNKSLNFL